MHLQGADRLSTEQVLDYLCPPPRKAADTDKPILQPIPGGALVPTKSLTEAYFLRCMHGEMSCICAHVQAEGLGLQFATSKTGNNPETFLMEFEYGKVWACQVDVVLPMHAQTPSRMSLDCYPP